MMISSLGPLVLVPEGAAGFRVGDRVVSGAWIGIDTLAGSYVEILGTINNRIQGKYYYSSTIQEWPHAAFVGEWYRVIETLEYDPKQQADDETDL